MDFLDFGSQYTQLIGGGERFESFDKQFVRTYPMTVIKSHHNVGGLPKRMKLKLVEPLRMLFKDEIRRLGRVLGLPDSVRAPELALLRKADWIFQEELRASGWYDKVWQAFTVLLLVRSVGVMGDERTYENVVALRAVGSTDGMTADWSRLPYDLPARVSGRIVSEVRGINRVVYINSKPPSTIEWE